ncbi:MAG: hypothetical protein K6B14_00420 [Lachnospiraceae bacterium]|nr:hypothetical protein [Lachnospiraceae bacterium]
MEHFRVLVCDEDISYVRSLCHFMAWTKDEIRVSAFTDVSDFLNDEGKYDLGLLGRAFLLAYEKERPDVKLTRVMYLCNETDDRIEDVESLYKYQSMDTFLDRIYSAIRQDDVMKMITGMHVKRGSSTGIFSPIWHDLRLPFSMAYTKTRNTDGKALFVDLETISILPELLGRNVENDLLDLLYLMKTEDDPSFSLEEFIWYFEGIALLPPMRNPGRIAEITGDEWERLFETAEKNGYQLVVLMDQMLQGFEDVISRMKELIILGRPEDYYRKAQGKFMSYLTNISEAPDIQEVILPMSATNLADGTYEFGQLLEGNLGNFVRRELA